MSETHDELSDLTPAEAAAQAMNTDLGERFKDAEAVRERRPAKMVTALRIDLDLDGLYPMRVGHQRATVQYGLLMRRLCGPARSEPRRGVGHSTL